MDWSIINVGPVQLGAKLSLMLATSVYCKAESFIYLISLIFDSDHD